MALRLDLPLSRKIVYNENGNHVVLYTLEDAANRLIEKFECSLSDPSVLATVHAIVAAANDPQPNEISIATELIADLFDEIDILLRVLESDEDVGMAFLTPRED